MALSSRPSSFWLRIALGTTLIVLSTVLVSFLISQLVLVSCKLIETHWGTTARDYYVHTLYPVSLVAVYWITTRRKKTEVK